MLYLASKGRVVNGLRYWLKMVVWCRREEGLRFQLVVAFKGKGRGASAEVNDYIRAVGEAT